MSEHRRHTYCLEDDNRPRFTRSDVPEHLIADANTREALFPKWDKSKDAVYQGINFEGMNEPVFVAADLLPVFVAAEL